ncbi:MAG: ABC transporter permease [Vicinamibacteria bacterium]
MTQILRDARFGLRLLWRNPGFTSVAVLALALGIAANSAIFSVVYATLLAPLPFPNPDRLVMVWSRIQGNRNVTAAATYLEWKRQSTVFQDLNAFTGRGVSLSTSTDAPEQVQAGVATPGFYKMIGNPFVLGRDFLPEEGQVGKDHVVILTHRFWEERFGSDPAVIGREVRIDGKPHTIVGVMAAGPPDRGQGRLFVPLAFEADQLNHDFHWLLIMGRLKAGVTLAQADANMKVVTDHIAEAYPQSNKGWSASVEPLQNNFLSRDTISALWLLLGAVAFVLLIACVNVANLLLARGTARMREVAVRSSLGAGRAQIFGQFLTESVVLSSIGGLLGVALSWVLLRGIMAMMPPYTLPTEADVRLNVPVLLFTLAASVLSGILFGCAPAWQATRANLNDTLKEAGRAAISGGRHRLRRGLAVVEFALALTLLAGGGLAIHSVFKLAHVDLGFRSDHLLTFSLPVPNGRLAQPEQVSSFYAQLLEKMRAVPGVSAVSASTGMPVQGTGFGMPFYIAGKPFADPSARPGAGFNMVTPDYFRTFGIEVERGRPFTEQDSAGAVPVAIVNDAFVKKYFPDVDPLTQRIVVEQLIPGVTKLGPAVEWQIVGVYRNVKNGGPKGDGFPEIDVPFWQSPWPGTVMAVRTSIDPASTAKSLAAVVRSVDADLPLADVKTMDQMVDEALAGDRFNAVLFGGFAGVALLLAALGIYGVMSFAVAQRTHEIGLRMALGAGRHQVLQQVLREGITTALVGVVLGSVGAYFVGRTMQGMVYGVGVMDPAVFSVVATTLVASAVVACLVPARRAASVDPMTALRQE